MQNTIRANPMKKDKRKYKLSGENPMTENLQENDLPVEEGREEGSIEDFIELKKLQNRILGKMIENINKSKNKNNPKTK
jgi:hypothetical protein